MVRILEARKVMYNIKDNPFATETKVAYYDSIIRYSDEGFYKSSNEINKGNALLEIGREAEAVKIIESAINKIKSLDGKDDPQSLRLLAMAYMRLGEKQNCVNYHNSQSCIIPISKKGIHVIQQGSLSAIDIYKKLLNINPRDYESRWLLNIAYMTLGTYPAGVPHELVIPGLDKDNSGYRINPFTDVAANVGIQSKNMSGGVIVDDFNNDNYLDIITSEWSLNGTMHYYKNNKKGGYTDCSEISEIGRFKGGLNMIQADYNNDGNVDVFVFRGAWMHKYGRQPNSLLQNNGDGSFTDVTIKSGLYSEFPTQAGNWNDFNNDGFLDLFIGNESSANESYPCELYLNNQDGTFTNVAKAAGCNIVSYIKGVTAADYDNDGDVDVFLSGMNNRKILLNNTGLKKGIPQFKDVTNEAGLATINAFTFPTWFWDYDNDGWQDIFVSGYQLDGSIAGNTAMQYLGITNNCSKMYLYHNNHDGTFSDASLTAGLNKSIFSMGANFGDIDNDGFLDMYLGTGNPDYRSLTPNKLFRNMGNGQFADVTVSGHVGNLQKGHGVAINDLDNDGDADIFIEMGGAFAGDAFSNSLYLNPGQNNNHWIKLLLEGTGSNHSAIGTKVKITFKENGISRSVYRVVNSGGSFGASALRMEIGTGQAAVIDEIEIIWPKDQKRQVFKNIRTNQCIKITEGTINFSKVITKKTPFPITEAKSAICI